MLHDTGNMVCYGMATSCMVRVQIYKLEMKCVVVVVCGWGRVR